MKILFFDTETTGVESDDQILQFGGIYGNFDSGVFNEERRINQYINVNKEISIAAERIHGINKSMIKKFGYIEEYIDEILLYIKKSDYVVGHNVEFDIKMLKQECNRIGKNFDRDNIKSFCTMKETIDIISLPGKKRPKLSELYYYLFNKHFDNAHDAMADIEATRDCLIELIKRGKIKDFKDNLKELENIDLRKSLVSAAAYGDEETVRLLIKAGVSLDSDRREAHNALMIASSNGHLEVVKILIESGANINYGTEESNPLLHATSSIQDKNKQEEIIRFLIEAGANVNIQDRQGCSALSNVIRISGNKELVQLFISKGCRPVDELLVATYGGHKEIVEMLIKAGANVNYNCEGETALIIASKLGHKEIVEILIKRGAYVNIGDYEGETALMIASKLGHKEIVEMLIKGGADVNICNYEGETALIMAKNLAIEEILEKHGALNNIGLTDDL